MTQKEIRNMKSGALIAELVRKSIKATKEINSPRGLSKQTDADITMLTESLRVRGLLTQEDIDRINQ